MRDRLRAFLIHLLLSVLILSVTLALVALVWYPAPLFRVDGGREVIQLIAFVDVFLGPALTFVVYRRGKKSLKFDLGVIAAFQLAALAYGAATMYQQRPVFVAFAQEMFYTVTAEQVEELAPKKLKELAPLMPRASNWVYVAPPQEQAGLQELFSGKLVPMLRSDLYQPLDEGNLRLAMARSVDMRRLLANPERSGAERDRLALERFLAEKQAKLDDLAFLPFVARYEQLFVVYRKADAALVGFLDIAPDLFVRKLQ